MIHETAIIDPSAKIAKNASIGAYSSIGKDVDCLLYTSDAADDW